MRNLAPWLVISVVSFMASAVSAVYGARMFKRSKFMTQIMDPRAARIHLLRFTARLAALMGVMMFLLCVLVGLLILLAQPNSLGQSALGALVTGVSAFVGNWIGFFIYDRLAR